MVSKETQELLATLNAIRNTDLLLDKDQKDFNEWCDEIKNAINELEEYKKYIPNLDDLYKWCKGDYLQTEGMNLQKAGMNLKNQSLKGVK